MREKKLGKYTICFITVCLSMIIMTLILSCLSKNKLSIRTLNGNLKDIGRVSLVYTPNISRYTYEEVTISKNGTRNDINPKTKIGNDYLHIDKKYSDFIDGKGIEFIYKDDLNIGVAYTSTKSNSVQERNNLNDYIKVSNKNLKSGLEENFDIDLKNLILKKIVGKLFLTKYIEEIYIW